MFKKRVVEKAYEVYSGLSPAAIPVVQPTIASPKQYGYRTKLTPHFDAPPRSAQLKKQEAKPGAQKTRADVEPERWKPRIGFDQKGRKSVLDIEVGNRRSSFKKSIFRAEQVFRNVLSVHL